MSSTSDAERRVWASMPAGSQQALTTGLSPTDLKTLLPGVAGEGAAAVSPAEVMRRWRQDRLVRPAASDPRTVAAVESRLWQLLPAAVDGVELSPLSPLVPLGTCSALGPVSQDKIVTTMRSAEVVSDSTNALAVEAATRRRGGAAEVHLAASLRAQPLGAGQAAHFRLFALVSSAPDGGSGTTETRLLGIERPNLRRLPRVAEVLRGRTGGAGALLAVRPCCGRGALGQPRDLRRGAGSAARSATP